MFDSRKRDIIVQNAKGSRTVWNYFHWVEENDCVTKKNYLSLLWAQEKLPARTRLNDQIITADKALK